MKNELLLCRNAYLRTVTDAYEIAMKYIETKPASGKLVSQPVAQHHLAFVANEAKNNAKSNKKDKPSSKYSKKSDNNSSKGKASYDVTCHH
jgi:hypothetical protein